MNTINFAQSIYANGLNKPNSYKFVYDLTGGYAAYTTLIRAITDMRKEAWEGVITTGDGKYEFAGEDVDWVVESITNCVQVSTGVIDVFYSGTNDFFRNKDTNIDDNWIQGKIVDHSPGRVRMSSVDVLLVAGTHYAIGGKVREFSNANPFRINTGMESRYRIPEKEYDLVQTFRESCFMAQTDFQSTYVEFDGKSWGHSQVNEALKRNEIKKERQFLFGNRAVSLSSPTPEYYTAGLEWIIGNRGGQIVPITSAPSFATFNNILYQHSLKKVKPKGAMNDLILCGKGWINYMQTNYTQDYVKYAGKNNTFGGDGVKGLNVMTYSIGNREYDIMEVPAMDDQQWYNVPSGISDFKGASRLSMSAFILDPNAIGGVGNGKSRAPLQQIWWGRKGINGKVIRGMVDENGDFTAMKEGSQNFTQTNSDVSGFNVEISEIVGQHAPTGKGMTYLKVVA